MGLKYGFRRGSLVLGLNAFLLALMLHLRWENRESK